jgi:hypothetical protein
LPTFSFLRQTTWSTFSAFYRVIRGNSSSDVRQYGKQKSKNAFYYDPAMTSMKLEFAL